MIRTAGLALILSAAATPAAAQAPDRRLSNEGVTRAAATVDSVFVDRQTPRGLVTGGDWASYLLARLDAGPIPDSLGIEVRVDTAHVAVSGRLQDLPPETRQLLGPLASAVDSTTAIEADVRLERTGPRVIRFWLRALLVNGYRFPEFLLGPMMSRVGRQYPALTASGRDLYIQVPEDGTVTLGDGAVILAIPTAPAGTPPPRGRS